MVRDAIGSTSYSSSGVLIKEDEQKTIAGPLLSGSQILECGFKKKKMGIGMAGPWKGVGVENQKERELFHYVNEEKRQLTHKCIFEVGF